MSTNRKNLFIGDKILNFVLDLFFPKNCIGCNKKDTYLCPECFKKIEINPNNICFFCKKITWQNKTCINCQKQTQLDKLISAVKYANPLNRKLIKNFKYKYVKELSKPLSRLMIKSLKGIEDDLINLDFIVIPIPLHKTRLRKRGFNQAELLAKRIANHYGLPIDNGILKRKKSIEPQANIKNYTDRRKNIKEVFEINSDHAGKIKNKYILLVDDVATTGATLSEAAKTIRPYNPQEIWGLTVAQG